MISEQTLARFGPKLYIGQVAAGGATTPAAKPAAAATPVAPVVAAKKPAEQKKERRALIAHPNKFGEQVPYGDPSWYQEWNRYKNTPPPLEAAISFSSFNQSIMMLYI